MRLHAKGTVGSFGGRKLMDPPLCISCNSYKNDVKQCNSLFKEMGVGGGGGDDQTHTQNPTTLSEYIVN